MAEIECKFHNCLLYDATFAQNVLNSIANLLFIYEKYLF